MANYVEKKDDDGTLLGVVVGVLLVVIVGFIVLNLDTKDATPKVPDTVRVDLPDVNVQAPQASAPAPEAATN